MSETALRVEGLGKQYRLGLHENAAGGMYRYKSLRDTFGKFARQPWKTLTAGRGPMTEKNSFWALKDIGFEVKRGEVVGIIGRNGAGKSTLLKILSRITKPTTGNVALFGRVGSLLEVGTGFHPELTGRENIYLNGAVLGMTKTEVKSRFDEIVAFSEIEKFLDTTVKQYSSGMYMRLAFAVAAHLEPEILVVDEVLAVGDAAFQHKCLGKMKVVAEEGRTVMFVSHNLGAVRALCASSVLLEGGCIRDMGDTAYVLNTYLASSTVTTQCANAEQRPGSGEYRYTAFTGPSTVEASHPICFTWQIEHTGKSAGRPHAYASAHVVDASGTVVAQCDSRYCNLWISGQDKLAGQLTVRSPWLKPGPYSVDAIIYGGGFIDLYERAHTFDVPPMLPFSGTASSDGIGLAPVLSDFDWRVGNAEVHISA